MKITIIIFSMLILILAACKKEKQDQQFQPLPNIISIQFGHFNMLNFIPYANQNNVPIDTIIGYDDLVIALTEKNIPNIKSKNTDTLVFNFNVTTDNDEENFNKTDLNGSTSYFSFGSSNEMAGKYIIPYTITPVAIKNNGVLEIKNLVDNIKVDFTSYYSSSKSSKTLIIKQ
ncbi:MAG: hypothetical protein Q8K70_10290 [Bacteroidota bacterium]|nr:hypothetical protein [Bacteroidota bacterium]